MESESTDEITASGATFVNNAIFFLSSSGIARSALQIKISG